MARLSGATKQALVQLLDQEATHSIIESLFLRFEVKPFPSDTSPNKLTKATRLVQAVSERSSGPTTLMSLIDYVGSPSFRRPAFARGSAAAVDLYSNLDLDLAKTSSEPSRPKTPPSSPPRQFRRPGTSTVSETDEKPDRKRYVFVVRGRDSSLYNALAEFLFALDLRIVTWDDAARGAGGGTPLTLDIVRAGIDMSDAVVVLMTPDDLGHVKPEYHDPRDHPRESVPSGQARQNVVFEAGWAMALNQERVVMIRVGDVRPLSDVDGLNYVWLTDDISSRKTLISRLRACKLAVETEDDRWRTAGHFPLA